MAGETKTHEVVTGAAWVFEVRAALDRGEEVRVVAHEHDPHDFRMEWPGGVLKVQVP
jgi:hypothetical protein